MLLYGVINFQARKALGLTNNEFIYLFAVRYFERDRDGGFCSVWASEMSDIVGIDARNIGRLKKRLEDEGLLIIRPDGAVRVTDAFRDICNAAQANVTDYFSGKEPSEGYGEMPTPPGKKSTPPRQNAVPPPGVSPYPPPAFRPTPPAKRPTINKEYNKESKLTLLNRVCTTHTNEKKENENFENGNGEGEKATTLVCLFRECDYFKGGAAGRKSFEADLKAAGCPGEVDFDYYFNRILTWSDKNGAKSKDWGKTALKFVQDDAKQGHMATVQFMPIDQQPQQAQPQHATHSRRNGSSRKNAISHAQVLADVERIIADGW